MTITFPDLVGFVGVAMILVCYFWQQTAGVEEVLLDSVDDLAVLSLVDFEAVSDFESPEDLESEESELEDDELSLEPFLLSDGDLGRP